MPELNPAHFCLSCGESFQPASPDALLCPKCGGPPEAKLTTEAESRPQDTQVNLGFMKPPAFEVPAWQPGQVLLDTYEVKGLLGEGGMGKVYRVHHRGWNVDLAVKRPRGELFTQAHGKENFVREAETWIELGLHPHITSCYYVRLMDDIPAVFAECVEGGSLESWIESRRLYEGGKEKALERILDIAIQFAWGLEYAHEQGLVHQDVKPHNVLMTPEGAAKVTDFGLARARAMAEEGITPTSSPMVSAGGYTPAYCSPEQVRGEKLSPKTDIWSWAVSVLEMFTGEVSWLSGLAASAVLESYLDMGMEFEDIPFIPPELARLMGHCLREQPDERPEDMARVAAALQAIYQQVRGQAYARQQSKAVELHADSLNNKALSFWDLGKQEEAEKAWDQALAIEPHHPLAAYNGGLIHWRAARITDDILVRNLREAAASHSGDWLPVYLLLLVHLERDDCVSAFMMLKELPQEWLKRGEFIEMYKKVLERGRRSGGLQKEYTGHHADASKEYAGHYDEVSTVAVSPDGKCTLTGSRDGKVKLWDVESGECLRTYKEYDAFINCVALSADGTRAAAGCSSNRTSARCWDFRTGNYIHHFGHYNDWVNELGFSADGKYVLTGGYSGFLESLKDAALILWDANTGEKLCELKGHRSTIIHTSFSLDNRFAYSGSEDNQLRIWEIPGGKCLQVRQGPATEQVHSMALSPDGRVVLSGCKDGTAILWEAGSGKSLHVLRGHAGAVLAVYLTHDGRRAFTGSRDYTVRLWDLSTGRCLRTYERHIGAVNDLCLSVDEHSLFSGSADKTMVRWQVGFELPAEPAPFMLARITAGEAISEHQAAFRRALEQASRAMENEDYSNALAHLKTARALPGFEHASEALHEWRRLYRHFARPGLRESREIASFQIKVSAACLRADGSSIIAGDADGQLMLLASQNGTVQQKWQAHAGKVTAIALSQDGQTALSGGQDSLAKFWDLTSGRCLQTFTGHEKMINCAALSADRRFALTGGMGSALKLWDVASGRCLRSMQFDDSSYSWIDAVALDACGELALCRWEGWFEIWNLAKPELLRRMVANADGEKGMCLSYDGKHALLSGDRSLLHTWNLNTGQRVRSFAGHEEPVNAVCFSLDDRYALSGSQDRTVKLWEVASGRCLRTFEGHRAPVQFVSLSADGFYLLSYSEDGVFKVWDLDWELEIPPALDEERLHAVLSNFLSTHTPIGEDGIRRSGEAAWSEADFQGLMAVLGDRGLGWLKPGEVRRSLEEIPRRRAGLLGEFARATASAQQALEQGNTCKAAQWLRQARTLEGYERNPGGWDAWAKLYTKLPRRNLRNGWEARTYTGHEGYIKSVAISPDGRYALSAEERAILRFWEIATGKCLQAKTPGYEEIRAVCFSPDGKLALSAGGALHLWKVKDGSLLKTLYDERSDEVHSVCFSSDGSLALSGERNDTFRIWDVHSGRCLRVTKAHDGWVLAVSFSPDERYIFTGSTDSTIKQWETASGRHVRTFTGSQGGVKSVCVSSNGKHMVTCSEDVIKAPPVVRVWDLESGDCVRTIAGSRDQIDLVSLGAEGRFTLSSGRAELTVWDVQSREPVFTLGGHGAWIRTACFSRDGCYILSGSHDKTVRLWQLDWELEEKEPADWDEGAGPYLDAFLTLHTPCVSELPKSRAPTEAELTLALTRRGKPTWNEEDFQHLLYNLGCAGYGWLRPDGVGRKLEEMARER